MTGDQIKGIREKLGLNTAEFADLLGVQNSSVYRWEACANDKTRIEGLPKRLVQLMSKLSAKNAKIVADEIRNGGWVRGLYKLLGIAYKKT